MGEIKGSSLVILRITILYFLLSIGHPWFYLKNGKEQNRKGKDHNSKKTAANKDVHSCF